MNQLPDTVLLIMGAICIVPTVYMLIIFKDIKVVIAGLIILIGSQVAVFALHGEPSWHVIALLFFPIAVILYMMVKIKQRINAALKRIAQLEEEERQEKECVANKELNPFVGDDRDHDSV
jgi:Ca2+/Na+ antiporter